MAFRLTRSRLDLRLLADNGNLACVIRNYRRRPPASSGRGGNTVHGSMFGYHYNEKMKARPDFLPATDSKPRTRQNQ
jgi:hypothetical protein